MAQSMLQTTSCLRRRTSRVESSEGVYAFWSCDGRDELSRVRDLGLGGLFVESHAQENIGALVKLNFLADEGQIRASAVVCHVTLGQGLGLKFVAINDGDCQRLAGLMNRLRN